MGTQPVLILGADVVFFFPIFLQKMLLDCKWQLQSFLFRFAQQSNGLVRKRRARRVCAARGGGQFMSRLCGVSPGTEPVLIRDAHCPARSRRMAPTVPAFPLRVGQVQSHYSKEQASRVSIRPRDPVPEGWSLRSLCPRPSMPQSHSIPAWEPSPGPLL